MHALNDKTTAYRANTWLDIGWGSVVVGSCISTRILKISIKNFKRFRNVRKSIETSGDISVRKGFRTSDAQRNVMGQSTEMSPLVSMLFRAFLNSLKFLMF